MPIETADQRLSDGEQAVRLIILEMLSDSKHDWLGEFDMHSSDGRLAHLIRTEVKRKLAEEWEVDDIDLAVYVFSVTAALMAIRDHESCRWYGDIDRAELATAVDKRRADVIIMSCQHDEIAEKRARLDSAMGF